MRLYGKNRHWFFPFIVEAQEEKSFTQFFSKKSALARADTCLEAKADRTEAVKCEAEKS